MTQGKSNYVLRLQELGFKKVSGQDGKTVLAEIEQMLVKAVGKISRNQRRQMRRQLREIATNMASFTVTVVGSEAITEASDDTGQLWEAPGQIDLTPFGFANNAEWFRNHIRAKKATLNS